MPRSSTVNFKYICEGTEGRRALNKKGTQILPEAGISALKRQHRDIIFLGALPIWANSSVAIF
jgi:hypothetical protein